MQFAVAQAPTSSDRYPDRSVQRERESKFPLYGEEFTPHLPIISLIIAPYVVQIRVPSILRPVRATQTPQHCIPAPNRYERIRITSPPTD